jgi:hypothetical protein
MRHAGGLGESPSRTEDHDRDSDPPGRAAGVTVTGGGKPQAASEPASEPQARLGPPGGGRG